MSLISVRPQAGPVWYSIRLIRRRRGGIAPAASISQSTFLDIVDAIEDLELKAGALLEDAAPGEEVDTATGLKLVFEDDFEAANSYWFEYCLNWANSSKFNLTNGYLEMKNGFIVHIFKDRASELLQ
ncbi:MAG: hypothetical protein LBQ95_02655 [Lachnospiraceae bacterium]|nr:hypothetical protein [Lachnospiraceae bacterium]